MVWHLQRFYSHVFIRTDISNPMNNSLVVFTFGIYSDFTHKSSSGQKFLTLWTSVYLWHTAILLTSPHRDRHFWPYEQVFTFGMYSHFSHKSSQGQKYLTRWRSPFFLACLGIVHSEHLNIMLDNAPFIVNV